MSKRQYWLIFKYKMHNRFANAPNTTKSPIGMHKNHVSTPTVRWRLREIIPHNRRLTFFDEYSRISSTAILFTHWNAAKCITRLFLRNKRAIIRITCDF
jgi:hypothetical protein